jgi:hypothetical protein
MSDNNINMSIQQSPVQPQVVQPQVVQPQVVQPQVVQPQVQVQVAPQQSSNIEVQPIYESGNVSNNTDAQTTNNEAPTTIPVSVTLLQNMKAIITVMHERQAVKLPEMVVVGNVYNNITALLEDNKKTV